jgi:predicted peroxiredoxin
MRILYLASTGSSDPTRASIPLHLAVNGTIEVGDDAGVVLAGDATAFLRPDVLGGTEGVGLPPLRDLFGKARAHEVPVYV